MLAPLIMHTFYGHGLLNLCADFWNALGVVVFVPVLSRFFSSRAPWWLKVIPGLVFLLMMPNCTYAFLEIKHLIFKDGVADDLPWQAVIVFGSLSAFGLASSVLVMHIVVTRLWRLVAKPCVACLALGVLMSVGAVIGLHDIPSMFALGFPWKIPSWLWGVVNLKDLALIAGLTTLLATLTRATIRTPRPASV